MLHSEVAATWANAIATFLAVLIAFAGTAVALIIALRQEKWRREQYHPDIVVLASIEPPDCVQIPYVEHVLIPGQPTRREAISYYLQILVRNNGNDTARNVEVYAKALMREKGDKWEPVKEFPPLNLVWANSPPEHSTYLPFLPPGASRHCAVAHALDPKLKERFTGEHKPSLPPDKVSLTFDLVAKPNHLGHIIGPGKYRLNIEVAAENFDALGRVIEIWFDGTWIAEASQMFGYHLRIGVSPECSEAQ